MSDDKKKAEQCVKDHMSVGKIGDVVAVSALGGAAAGARAGVAGAFSGAALGGIIGAVGEVTSQVRATSDCLDKSRADDKSRSGGSDKGDGGSGKGGGSDKGGGGSGKGGGSDKGSGGSRRDRDDWGMRR